MMRRGFVQVDLVLLRKIKKISNVIHNNRIISRTLVNRDVCAMIASNDVCSGTAESMMGDGARGVGVGSSVDDPRAGENWRR